MEAKTSLLERRLVIVTGKGGTGKTTVSATLALAAARAGKQVLAAEVGRDEHLARLIDGDATPVGYAGREVAPGLTAMRIDPFAALSEYLGLQLGVKGLVDRVIHNHGFRQLMEAAPGWRELITLGKVWHLAQMQRPDGRPRYDLIVVDAPATGHGVTFLDVPRVVMSAVRVGPLRRNAGLVEEMIRDRRHTLLLPISLGEELPTRETTELVARLRDDLGVAMDRVVVNAVSSAPFPPGLEDLDRRLASLHDDLDLGALPPASTLAECASYLNARYELNRRYVEESARETGLPIVTLPHLPSGVRGPDDLILLADRLLASDTAEDSP